jgi:hypothetical protein
MLSSALVSRHALLNLGEVFRVPPVKIIKRENHLIDMSVAKRPIYRMSKVVERRSKVFPHLRQSSAQLSTAIHLIAPVTANFVPVRVQWQIFPEKQVAEFRCTRIVIGYRLCSASNRALHVIAHDFIAESRYLVFTEI